MLTVWCDRGSMIIRSTQLGHCQPTPKYHGTGRGKVADALCVLHGAPQPPPAPVWSAVSLFSW